MLSIGQIDISNKKVFVRCDLNVPLDDSGAITDDSRIRAVLPTLQYVLHNGGKLIVASHLGRPKGKPVPEFSLAPVAKRLETLLGCNVVMTPDCIGESVRILVERMNIGDVLLLENLRFHAQEERNEDAFAKELASLCDVYVNDAFAVSHRANASVEAITRHVAVSAAGFLMNSELDYFEKAMKAPERPLVAIIGGSKVSSKLAALENLLNVVDKFIIGGAMANTFIKSMNLPVGKSMIENELVPSAASIMEQAFRKGIKFYLPVDAIVANHPDSNAEHAIVPIQEIPTDQMILDIGPATSQLYQEAIYNAKTIVWNGPMGVFELDAFSRGTAKLAQGVAESGALTIVGGGDTIAALNRTGTADKMSFISTGGGAFLELLEGKILPGVAALERN